MAAVLMLSGKSERASMFACALIVSIVVQSCVGVDLKGEAGQEGVIGKGGGGDMNILPIAEERQKPEADGVMHIPFGEVPVEEKEMGHLEAALATVDVGELERIVSTVSLERAAALQKADDTFGLIDSGEIQTEVPLTGACKVCIEKVMREIVSTGNSWIDALCSKEQGSSASVERPVHFCALYKGDALKASHLLFQEARIHPRLRANTRCSKGGACSDLHHHLKHKSRKVSLKNTSRRVIHGENDSSSLPEVIPFPPNHPPREGNGDGEGGQRDGGSRNRDGEREREEDTEDDEDDEDDEDREEDEPPCEDGDGEHENEEEEEDGGAPDEGEDDVPLPPHYEDGMPPPHYEDGLPPPHYEDGMPPPHYEDDMPLSPIDDGPIVQLPDFVPVDSVFRFESTMSIAGLSIEKFRPSTFAETIAGQVGVPETAVIVRRFAQVEEDMPMPRRALAMTPHNMILLVDFHVTSWLTPTVAQQMGQQFQETVENGAFIDEFVARLRQSDPTVPPSNVIFASLRAPIQVQPDVEELMITTGTLTLQTTQTHSKEIFDNMMFVYIGGAVIFVVTLILITCCRKRRLRQRGADELPTVQPGVPVAMSNGDFVGYPVMSGSEKVTVRPRDAEQNAGAVSAAYPSSITSSSLPVFNEDTLTVEGRVAYPNLYP